MFIKKAIQKEKFIFMRFAKMYDMKLAIRLV